MAKITKRFSIGLLLKLMFGSILLSIIGPVLAELCTVIKPVIRIYISSGLMIIGIFSYIASFSTMVYLIIMERCE